MKNPRKITRIQLSPDDKDVPSIIGIVSSDPDYRLAMKINDKLHLFLKGSTPVLILGNDGKELTFSKFIDLKGSPDVVSYLYANRFGKNFLLKKLKNIDYIFLMHDPGKSYPGERITSGLREIDSVTAVFNLEFKDLKDNNIKYLEL